MCSGCGLASCQTTNNSSSYLLEALTYGRHDEWLHWGGASRCCPTLSLCVCVSVTVTAPVCAAPCEWVGGKWCHRLVMLTWLFSLFHREEAGAACRAVWVWVSALWWSGWKVIPAEILSVFTHQHFQVNSSPVLSYSLCWCKQQTNNYSFHCFERKLTNSLTGG